MKDLHHKTKRISQPIPGQFFPRLTIAYFHFWNTFHNPLEDIYSKNIWHEQHDQKSQSNE